jgi:glycosyltransferase involved in cell wall biosynthesis
MASSGCGDEKALQALDAPPTYPTISVVIPVRDSAPLLRRCLAALTHTKPPPAEVIVVADACTDDSSRVAEEFGARVIELPTRSGPARARNIGARAAGGDVLFFVDADVAIHSNALARVRAAFREDPELAAIFGSYDDIPGETNFLSQYKNLLHHFVHQSAREDASTFWAGCGAIRRDVFLELGGFDESFRRPSIEDIELGYRLRRAGHNIRLDKALQGTHWKRWTPLTLLASDFLDRALPWTMLISRDRRMLDDLNLRWGSRVSVVLAWGIAAGLVAAWAWPDVLVLVGLSAAALTWLNLPLYRFFYQERGLRFALQAIPWHWLYYFYSGLAFGIGVTGLARGRFRAATSQAKRDSS